MATLEGAPATSRTSRDTLGKSPWYPDRELVLGGRRGRTAACGRWNADEFG